MADLEVLALRDERDALRAQLAEAHGRLAALEDRVAAGIGTSTRYVVRAGSRREVQLHCVEHTGGPLTDWIGSCRLSQVEEAVYVHERQHGGGARPTGLPVRDLVESLGVLADCVVMTTTYGVGGGVNAS